MSTLNQVFKMAVLAGVESAVQLHINRGDDLNARDSNGLTLLMLSAAKNKSSMCKLLLSAGADSSLLDPVGRTAFMIAIAAGAHEAANTLRVSNLIPESSKLIDPSVNNIENLSISATCSDAIVIESDLSSLSPGSGFNVILECDDFDLAEWEPEKVSTPPEHDSPLLDEVSAVQIAISAHSPFDSSADWDDLHVYLPDQSAPLIRNEDVEARKNLRLLLLRAFREGSVPSMAVESLSMSEDGSMNHELEAILIQVVNDLGAEIDERFEYISESENFTVFISSKETEDEEELIDIGLYHIDGVMSRRFETTRIYLSNIQKIKLITAEDEIALAQQMENFRSRALDALAYWPKGLAELLVAGRSVYEKNRALHSVSMGPHENQSALNDLVEESVSETEAAIEESDELIDESIVSSSTLPIFFDALHRLSKLELDPLSIDAKNEIYGLLESLRLSTTFLLELVDVATKDVCVPSREYVSAMSGYLHSREQMMTANLKLAHHIAKKYLYSGEPLDDLVQEANIGLMKAVERFDWRKGFKFSTYAIWWIRQQAGRFVADSARTIRIPVHVYDKVQRLSKERRVFEIETGRPPNPDEIINRLGISLQNLEMLDRIPQELLSIDHEFDDELIDASALSDYVAQDPFDSCVESQFQRTLDDVVSSLDLREEKVIRLRFGIGTSAALTLEEVGGIYEVTRERVRQIEAKALRKLRQPSRLNKISLAFLGTLPELKETPSIIDDSTSRVGATAEVVTGIFNDYNHQISGTDPIIETEAKQDADLSFDLPKQTQERPEFFESPSTSKMIDLLLSTIRDSGVFVLDNRNSPSGKIWVDIADISEMRNRTFVRKLVDVGFEFRPGLGCWR